MRLGHHKEAKAAADKALAIFDRLVKAEPENIEHHVELARAWNHKGYILDDLRQSPEAMEAYRTRDRGMAWRRSGRSQGNRRTQARPCSRPGEPGRSLCRPGASCARVFRSTVEGLQLRREVRTAHPDSRGYAWRGEPGPRFGSSPGPSGDLHGDPGRPSLSFSGVATSWRSLLKVAARPGTADHCSIGKRLLRSGM